MRVALIGGVSSSLVTLEKLVQHELEISHVFGFSPDNTELVSGYQNLAPICESKSIAFTPFKKINDHISDIEALEVDFLFVVGISQLVDKRIIDSPKVGAIGFHPTKLPRGRGRAPIAWLVKEVQDGAATFFLLEEEADAGAIVAQQDFSVEAHDTAASVESKTLDAMHIALDNMLPSLKAGEWHPVAQNEAYATEFGARRPEDGLIEWHNSASDIDRLVKASSAPHPGAFTFYQNQKVEVLESRPEHTLKIKGVVGRVLKACDNELLVQTGNGLIWVVISTHASAIRVGQKLGYDVELELYQLKQEMLELKKCMEMNR
ncbi:hypothetical protein L1286_07965 [Pseudoalteromonas sp. SMS1]|uniref:methionyl-tRNA formyltransferase n=1 Tax=Pseudoalteromonas sp. SMS1 TaxID=2908894 RepID=UPI001F4575C1|nr:formyltransferase family protein [Pseudoalteromonas sp. SMS1]MCF2857401.1 hypothetical protein [Pseudoalteromonas sp. SMS1]